MDSRKMQIRINPESRTYYERTRKEGKTHWQAMKALSRQNIKIICYILKDKMPYQRKPLVILGLDIGYCDQAGWSVFFTPRPPRFTVLLEKR